MSADTNRIIDKVQRLLRLADGAATDGERDAALQQVQRLLDRYQLDMAAVDRAMVDDWCESFVDSFNPSNFGDNLALPIIRVLERFFFVQAYFQDQPWGDDPRRLYLFGAPHNVKIGEYVYCFLDHTFGEKWRARAAATGSYRGRRSYYDGLGLAVCRTLDQERDRRTSTERQALIRAERDVLAALHERHAITTTPMGTDRIDMLALDAGLRDGEDIRIRTALRSDGREAARLTG